MADDIEELGDEVHTDLAGRLTQLDGSMLVKHLTIAEIVTPDGGREIIATHSPDLKAWESLGMLEYMRAFETAHIADQDDDQ